MRSDERGKRPLGGFADLRSPALGVDETLGATQDMLLLDRGLAIRSVVVAVADTERREQIVESWRAQNCSVATVATGLGVLEQLAEALLSGDYMDATPILMVLDDHLPGVLGRTIVDGIRDLGWTTPVLLFGERERLDDPWTVTLPVAAAPSLVRQTCQSLVERHAEFAELAQPPNRAGEMSVALGVVAFRWVAYEDTIEMSPPLHSGQASWSSTLSDWLANFHPKDRAPVARRLMRFGNGQTSRLVLEARWRAKHGRYRWVEIRGRKEEGEVIVGALIDIDRIKRRERNFARAAQRDGMTKLCNRSEFERRLAIVSRRTDDFGMLYLDLNDFKAINDVLGHLAGDELLRRVGERLRACVRQGDLIGRLGGDEFGILIVGPLATARMPDVEARIHAAMEVPFNIANHTLMMSVSLGSVQGAHRSGSASSIMEAADSAMYRNKRGRRTGPVGM